MSKSVFKKLIDFVYIWSKNDFTRFKNTEHVRVFRLTARKVWLTGFYKTSRYTLNDKSEIRSFQKISLNFDRPDITIRLTEYNSIIRVLYFSSRFWVAEYDQKLTVDRKT